MMNDPLTTFALSYVPSIYRRVIKAIDETPDLGLAELSVKCVCTHEAVRSAVLMLRRYKIIYISSWRKGTSGPPMPKYSIGNLPNAARPPKKSHSQRSIEWRRKKQLQQKMGASMWGGIL